MTSESQVTKEPNKMVNKEPIALNNTLVDELILKNYVYPPPLFAQRLLKQKKTSSFKNL